jgi:hypothetical protein
MQLAQHVCRSNELGIIIANALEPGEVPDGANGCPILFSHSLRDIVGHGNKLTAMIVKKRMEIAEVNPGHVPVNILDL